MHSDLTGQRASSGSLISLEGKWEVDKLLEAFKGDTKSFIETYFDEGEIPEDRVIDYDNVSIR